MQNSKPKTASQKTYNLYLHEISHETMGVLITTTLHRHKDDKFLRRGWPKGTKVRCIRSSKIVSTSKRYGNVKA